MVAKFLTVLLIIPVLYFLLKGLKALLIPLGKVFKWLWHAFKRWKSYLLFRVFGYLLGLSVINGILYIFLQAGNRRGSVLFMSIAVTSIVLWGIYIWVQMIKDIRGKKNQSNITENTDQE